jgi:hypothetical protein
MLSPTFSTAWALAQARQQELLAAAACHRRVRAARLATPSAARAEPGRYRRWSWGRRWLHSIISSKARAAATGTCSA